MKRMEQLREVYERTPIPAELKERVSEVLADPKDEIKPGAAEYIAIKKESKDFADAGANRGQGERNMMSGKKVFKRVGAAVAAAVILTAGFGIGVLKNEAFAASVSDIPLLGALAKVITGEEITKVDDVVDIHMKIPKVEGLSDKAVEDRINKEIRDKMTAKVKEAEQRAIEDKKAWLDTGGDPREYIPRYISVDYSVKAVTDDVLSFIVSEMEIGANAAYDLYYYNIDLHTNKELTLKDLLGEDYIAIANAQIAAQIAERSKEPGNMFFDGSDGIEGFTSISENQGFYINEKGHPVVVFNKYEIAPGYMGILEFEITPPAGV